MEQILNALWNIIKNDSGYIILIIVVLSTCIEIAPIKINPLSFLFKWIGDIINKDIKEQLHSVSTQLDDVSDRIDKIEINDTRSTILDFANSCMNERRHTKEEFDHMIDLHTEYEEKIAEKGMKNGRVDLAFKYISDLYMKCQKEDSFLDSKKSNKSSS